MAIISFTNYKRGQTTGCMGAVMRYTMQDKKMELKIARGHKADDHEEEQTHTWQQTM